MNIDATHIKDLQILLAVVEANGIANARAILNKDASTISRAISSLEIRLGLKLCERGRQGFCLTQEGEVLVDETLKLFSSFRTFEHRIETMNGKGTGRLGIGIIDNLITDSQCTLDKAIGEISNYFQGRVHIDLIVKNPYDLETHLLDKRIDIALGIFESRHDSICYIPLYQETDYLYCATDSAVAQLLRDNAAEANVVTCLKAQKFAARTFLNKTDVQDAGFQVSGEISFTSNLEAIAFMLLSGQFIGFLPSHYAQRHIDAGRLQPILPSAISRTSNIELAHRKGEEKTRKIMANSLRIFKNN
ncbi:MAG: LysR family transcriptional regulator [Zhongshania sp.]|nr:LysR family transcriptional regulator [Zhongshania sp.]